MNQNYTPGSSFSTRVGFLSPQAVDRYNYLRTSEIFCLTKQKTSARGKSQVYPSYLRGKCHVGWLVIARKVSGLSGENGQLDVVAVVGKFKKDLEVLQAVGHAVTHSFLAGWKGERERRIVRPISSLGVVGKREGILDEYSHKIEAGEWFGKMLLERQLEGRTIRPSCMGGDYPKVEK